MMKVTNFCFVLCLLVLVPVFVSGQTAAELEDVLETPAITCSQAARFVAASCEGDASRGGDASHGCDASTDTKAGGGENAGTSAFESAMSKGWLPKGAKAEEPISLGTLSFLMMKAFDIKGGMMYALIPGPRYAFRVMVSRSYIQSPADPDLQVSGERFLIILGNVLNQAGEKQ